MNKPEPRTRIRGLSGEKNRPNSGKVMVGVGVREWRSREGRGDVGRGSEGNFLRKWEVK